MPGFVHIERCLGITQCGTVPQQLHFSGCSHEGSGLSWTGLGQFVTSRCPVPEGWAASPSKGSKLIFSLGQRPGQAAASRH